MEAIVERCCGLDVHQASVVACALVGEAGCKLRKEVRTFGSMRRVLEALAIWLGELRCADKIGADTSVALTKYCSRVGRLVLQSSSG